MFKKILVTTDGSELSAKATTAAIDLARLAAAELIALTVAPRYIQSYYEGALTPDPAQARQLEESWRLEARKIVDAVRVQAETTGVSCQAVLRQSNMVAEAVIEAAGQLGCDLIVMASHGRRGVGRLLLGSETQHVLTHSRIPVLVLR